jgi:hypothetical protein
MSERRRCVYCEQLTDRFTLLSSGDESNCCVECWAAYLEQCEREKPFLVKKWWADNEANKKEAERRYRRAQMSKNEKKAADAPDVSGELYGGAA